MPALVGRNVEQDANVLNTIAVALRFTLDERSAVF